MRNNLPLGSQSLKMAHLQEGRLTRLDCYYHLALKSSVHAPATAGRQLEFIKKN